MYRKLSTFEKVSQRSAFFFISIYERKENSNKNTYLQAANIYRGVTIVYVLIQNEQHVVSKQREN